jgi:hypothetical protein
MFKTRQPQPVRNATMGPMALHDAPVARVLSIKTRDEDRIARIEAVLEHSRLMLEDTDRIISLLEAAQGLRSATGAASPRR